MVEHLTYLKVSVFPFFFLDCKLISFYLEILFSCWSFKNWFIKLYIRETGPLVIFELLTHFVICLLTLIMVYFLFGQAEGLSNKIFQSVIFFYDLLILFLVVVQAFILQSYKRTNCSMLFYSTFIEFLIRIYRGRYDPP